MSQHDAHCIPNNMGFKSDKTSSHYIEQVGGTTDCYSAYRNKPKGETGNKLESTENKILVKAHYRGAKGHESKLD